MNETRWAASCAVFEGRIVVCGGRSNVDSLNTVTAYDHVADKWSYMPEMIEARGHNKSVAVKNKLFVVGGNTRTCQVFDSTCNKFVLLKKLSTWYTYYFYAPDEAVCIGNKLVVFCNTDNAVLFYDVENDVWSLEKLAVETNMSSFSCTKVPQIKFY